MAEVNSLLFSQLEGGVCLYAGTWAVGRACHVTTYLWVKCSGPHLSTKLKKEFLELERESLREFLQT